MKDQLIEIIGRSEIGRVLEPHLAAPVYKEGIPDDVWELIQKYGNACYDCGMADAHKSMQNLLFEIQVPRVYPYWEKDTPEGAEHE